MVFNSIWEPPSGEIESLLFALQAAIGAGFIGYFIGYIRGKNKLKEEEESKTMLLIDKYAYINRLKHVHPVEKITIALFLLLFSLLVKDKIVSLIIFTVMSAFTIFAAKIPFSYYLKLLLLPSFFLLSGTVTILFSFASKDTILPTCTLVNRHSEVGNYSFQQAMLKR